MCSTENSDCSIISQWHSLLLYHCNNLQKHSTTIVFIACAPSNSGADATTLSLILLPSLLLLTPPVVRLRSGVGKSQQLLSRDNAPTLLRQTVIWSRILRLLLMFLLASRLLQTSSWLVGTSGLDRCRWPLPLCSPGAGSFNRCRRYQSHHAWPCYPYRATLPISYIYRVSHSHPILVLLPLHLIFVSSGAAHSSPASVAGLHPSRCYQRLASHSSTIFLYHRYRRQYRACLYHLLYLPPCASHSHYNDFVCSSKARNASGVTRQRTECQEASFSRY